MTVSKRAKLIAALEWLGTYEAAPINGDPRDSANLADAVLAGNAGEYEFPEDMVAAYQWLDAELDRLDRAELERKTIAAVRKRYPNATDAQIRTAVRNHLKA